MPSACCAKSTAGAVYERLYFSSLLHIEIGVDRTRFATCNRVRIFGFSPLFLLTCRRLIIISASGSTSSFSSRTIYRGAISKQLFVYFDNPWFANDKRRSSIRFINTDILFLNTLWLSAAWSSCSSLFPLLNHEIIFYSPVPPCSTGAGLIVCPGEAGGNICWYTCTHLNLMAKLNYGAV